MEQSTLSGIRVKPVDFAKICGCSKQAVSAWIKSGKITLPPDGFLDPATAAAEYIKNTPKNKVKASVFKVLSQDEAILKNEIKMLSEKVLEQKKYANALVGAFDIIITTIKDDVLDGDFEYLNSLTDRTVIEKELTEIMSYNNIGKTNEKPQTTNP